MNMNHETHERHEKLLFKDEVYAIQGAIFEVYREMGCGFLEAVYHECLEKELRLRSIPFVSQKELNFAYKGQPLEQRYSPKAVHLTVRGELVEPPATHPEPFDKLRANGMFSYVNSIGYRLYLICSDKIIVELKAVSELANEHKAQLFNYLKASNLRLGLLVNFGHHPKAQIERIIL